MVNNQTDPKPPRFFRCSACGLAKVLTPAAIQKHRRNCTNQTVLCWFPLPNADPNPSPNTKKKNKPKLPFVHQRIGEAFHCLRCKRVIKQDNALQGHTRSCHYQGDPAADPVSIACARRDTAAMGSLDGQSTLNTVESTVNTFESDRPSSPELPSPSAAMLIDSSNDHDHDMSGSPLKSPDNLAHPPARVFESQNVSSSSPTRVIDLTEDVSLYKTSSRSKARQTSYSPGKENVGPSSAASQPSRLGSHPAQSSQHQQTTLPPSRSSLTRPSVRNHAFATPKHPLPQSTAQAPGFQGLTISSNINNPQRTPLPPSRRPTPAAQFLSRRSGPFLSSLQPGNLLASPLNVPTPQTPLFNPARRLSFQKTPTLAAGPSSQHDRRYTPYQRPLGTTADGKTIVNSGGRFAIATPVKTYAAAAAAAATTTAPPSPPRPASSQSRPPSTSRSTIHRTPSFRPSLSHATPSVRTPQPFPRLTPSPTFGNSTSFLPRAAQRPTARRETWGSPPPTAQRSSTPANPPPSVARAAQRSSTPANPPPSVARAAQTPAPRNQSLTPQTPLLHMSYRNPPRTPLPDVEEDELMVIPIPILDGDVSDILQAILETLKKKCSLCYYQGLPHHHTFSQCPVNATVRLATRHDTQYERWKGEVFFKNNNSHCWACYIPIGSIIHIAHKRCVKFHLGDIGYAKCMYKDTLNPMLYLAWRSGNMPYLLERFEGAHYRTITADIKTFSAWFVEHKKAVIPPPLLILYSIYLIRGLP